MILRSVGSGPRPCRHGSRPRLFRGWRVTRPHGESEATGRHGRNPHPGVAFPPSGHPPRPRVQHQRPAVRARSHGVEVELGEKRLIGEEPRDPLRQLRRAGPGAPTGPPASRRGGRPRAARARARRRAVGPTGARASRRSPQSSASPPPIPARTTGPKTRSWRPADDQVRPVRRHLLDEGPLHLVEAAQAIERVGDPADGGGGGLGRAAVQHHSAHVGLVGHASGSRASRPRDPRSPPGRRRRPRARRTSICRAEAMP